MKKYESNPFTLSFGSAPYEYIPRVSEIESITSNLFSNTPTSRCYIIAGVRESGKTVALTSVVNKVAKSDEWITIELNPEDDIQAERTVGYFVQARKNFQTITSDESAKVNARLFTTLAFIFLVLQIKVW